MTQRVYCNELERLMSGEEVWEAKFGRPSINRELTFKCPDQLCSAKFILRNCAFYLDAWETTFRLYSGSIHREDCSFVHIKKINRNMLIKQRQQHKFFMTSFPPTRGTN